MNTNSTCKIINIVFLFIKRSTLNPKFTALYLFESYFRSKIAKIKEKFYADSLCCWDQLKL